MMRRREFLQALIGAGLAVGRSGVAGARATDAAEGVVYLGAGDADYRTHAQAFNKRIVRTPKLIAVCASEAGVAQAIARARAEKLPIAVKSGGHSFEGFSLNDGGLVIDLTPMHAQTLSEAGRYVAQPSCRLMQVYEHLIPRGRLLPAGSCGMVGVAGLTLGGGYGLFSRRHGLACDALTGLRLIDGRGETHDVGPGSELFWACRGGGNGHFGVVTELRFDTVAAPARLWRHLFKAQNLTPPRVAEIAEAWFDLAAALPPEAFSAFVLNHKTLTILITNTLDDSPHAVGPALERLAKIMDKRLPDRHEPLMIAVRRYYGKLSPLNFKNASAGYYRDYRDIRPAAPAVFARVLETPELLFQINTLGGAIDNPALAGKTAYAHRSYGFLGEIQSYWEDPRREPVARRAVAEVQRQLRDAGVRAHYSNYPDLEFSDWAGAYYGDDGYRRLVALKRSLDPDDLFRYPQSVRP